MTTDLQIAFKALHDKMQPYTTLFKYAEGDQPLKYTSERLIEAFRNIDAKFQQNWCSVIIDAALDRLVLSGWNVKDKQSDAMIDDLYKNGKIALEAYDAHRAAMITGESYIIAWKNESELEVYYNDPRLCAVFYDGANPKRPVFAAKWWRDGQRYWHLTLYYPDHFEYYITSKQFKGGDLPASAASFVKGNPDQDKNEYGIIPVFHFRVARNGKGDLANVTSLQDAVNKLLSDMMVAAEYGAFKQRWVISNADVSALKNGPNEIWEVPTGESGEHAQVGQFEETPLENFLDAMDKLANSMAIISRTPKHYFYNAGADVSGEALLAMDAPLVKKVKQREANFDPTWRELASFLFRLNGKDIPASEVECVWASPESVQPETQAKTLLTNTQAGVPLVTAARWSGRTQAEIDQMLKDMEESRKATNMLSKALLAQARQNSNNNNTPPDGNLQDVNQQQQQNNQ